MDNKKITVFCSISKGEMKKVSSWLIPSLEKQKNISEINLYFINYTGKGIAYDGQNECGIVKIREINKNKQLGFGEAHNFAFLHAKPASHFLIINPDVYLHEDCISEMIKTMFSDDEIGIVEARQLPFEHPKEYDSETGETPWASGFGILVKSNFFKKVGGFDELFWMYCEDVDLSWRAWLNEYKVVYNPNAVAYHFTGAYFEYQPNRFYLEQFWSARNYFYIMYKFWGMKGEIRARNFFRSMNYDREFKDKVIESFEEVKKLMDHDFHKKNAAKLKQMKNKIKSVGFNQYHETI